MHRPDSSSLLSLLAAAASWTWLATAPQPAAAHPYPRDDRHDSAGSGFLMPNGCARYCGAENDLCCDQGEACQTVSGLASCHRTLAARGDDGWDYYTTTWTAAKTFTSTVSVKRPAATEGYSGPECTPPAGSGQESCGSICCDTNQYCLHKEQCAPRNWPGGIITTTVTRPGGSVVTTQYSAPYRVTSGTFTPTGTGTAIGSTGTSEGAVGGGTGAAGGTGSGLSGGAIAGIVVGTIAGVIILLLICACCLVRGLFHGIAALLGFGKKKDKSEKTTTTIEERYSRHGSAHSRRDHHGSWFGSGSRPSGAASRKDEKKSSGGGLLGLAGVLGTVALLLGLRKDKKKEPKPRSSHSSSYWSQSYSSSPSRTAYTHRSARRSRPPPSPARRHSRGPPSRVPSRRPPSPSYRSTSRRPVSPHRSSSRRPSHSGY